MRLLFVMAGGKHGGAETAFVDMCVALHEAGEHVEVVTRKNDIRLGRLEDAGIAVHTLPFGGRLDVYTPYKLTQIIRTFKPDIVQAYMSRAAAHTPRWSPSMKIPPYVTVGRMGSPYKLKYFKNMDYFIAVTPDLAAHVEREGVEPERIRTIPNFAEVEEAKTPVPRTDHGVPEDAPLALALGRLHRDKAFDTLIKAAAHVPDLHIWIAGEGPLRKELQALIKELGLEGRVRLLGWRTDRAALFQAADMCVFISREEGFGTVFVQSWSQKTPLIVSRADGPRQFVRDGEDGLMVPIDDAQATAQAIKRLISDPKLAQTLAKNGYERYKRDFTKPVCLQRYLAFYHDIRARAPNPR